MGADAACEDAATVPEEYDGRGGDSEFAVAMRMGAVERL